MIGTLPLGAQGSYTGLSIQKPYFYGFKGMVVEVLNETDQITSLTLF